MEVEEYRRMADVEHSHWWYAASRQLLEDILGDRARQGGRFLDVGAGTGATGAWLAEHGDLVACDFMPLALDLHRERHHGDQQALGYVSADVQRLPFADRSFDIVLCVTVLYHEAVVDPQAAVDEMARVVRPGGLVCLWEPGGRRLARAHDRETHAARRFARGDLVSLLATAGLTVERASGAYSFLLPPAAVKSLVERGKSTSDLDSDRSGLGGALGAAARVERKALAHIDLPAGLTVFATARG